MQKEPKINLAVYLRRTHARWQSMWVIAEDTGLTIDDVLTRALRETAPDHNADYYKVYLAKIKQIEEAKKQHIQAKDTRDAANIDSSRFMVKTNVQHINNAIFSDSTMSTNITDMDENPTPLALVSGEFNEAEQLKIDGGILFSFFEKDNKAWYQNTTKSSADVLGTLRRSWISLDNRMITLKEINERLGEGDSMDQLDMPPMLNQGFPMQVFLDAKKRNREQRQATTQPAPKPAPTEEQKTTLREIKKNLERRIKHDIEKINKLNEIAKEKLNKMNPEAAKNYKENNKALHQSKQIIKKHNTGNKARSLRRKAEKAN